MGKSPGKWIKTVLFGKKSSKSNFSKGRELLASSPTAKSLRLQYNSTEPNSVLNWLERWSASLLWKPIPSTKKVAGSKSQKKKVNPQTVDPETGRVKLSVRRIPSLNLDNVSTQSTSETEKPRRNLRKVSSHPADSVQEHPQNELEKVKRSLRKVYNPNTEGTIQSEADSEKPKYGLQKVLSFSDQYGVQNRPAVPSYMAATESAKAKLKAQGSPRLDQDGIENQNLSRRHSLPASTNKKTNSPSPRAQRPIHSGGKGGNKSDRSMLLSRDGNA